MHYGRFSAFLALVLLILLLWHCGVVPQLTFERQCRSVAGFEVKNQSLWRQYLIERRQHLVSTGNSTDRWPLNVTDHFTYTEDVMLHRTPDTTKNKSFRNDAYLSLKSTGELVARFRNLRLQYDTIETTMSRDCTDDYPSLYTGSGPYR